MGGRGHGSNRKPHATLQEVGAAAGMYFDGLSYRRTAKQVGLSLLSRVYSSLHQVDVGPDAVTVVGCDGEYGYGLEERVLLEPNTPVAGYEQVITNLGGVQRKSRVAEGPYTGQPPGVASTTAKVVLTPPASLPAETEQAHIHHLLNNFRPIPVYARLAPKGLICRNIGAA